MIKNAMGVLELFSMTRSEIGVVEAAELLGKPKSTVSRWLSAMDAAGFLMRDPESGRYRISMRLAALGEVARRSTPLQRLARQALERLAALTGETADLAIMVGSEAMNLEVVESPRPIMHVGWVGRRLPLHASAAGKALVAWLPQDVIRGYLPDPLPRWTDWTITSWDVFLEELAGVRERGYSVAWAEMESDMAAAGAPVRNHLGEVVAALAIAGPISRMSREVLHGFGRDVAEVAAGVSYELGYRPVARR